VIYVADDDRLLHNIGTQMLRIFSLVACIALSSLPAMAGKVTIIGGMGGSDHMPTFQDSYRNRNLKKEIVAFDRDLPPGTILVRTAERKLFYVLEGRKAIAFPVGVGREGYSWSGQNQITRKIEWPDWRPPQEMIEREAERGHYLPKLVRGGPENPLGARALYIGDTLYRIHGTSAPSSIGRASSSGCIRMLNDHVMELFELAAIGAKVIVE
jgi:lipoprotein-anchoring transpeptidase ErfK/SrfK